MKFKTLSVAIAAFVICMLTIPTARADVFWAYGWRTTDTIAGSSTGGSPASLTDSNCYSGPGGGACTFANYDVFFQTNNLPDLDIEFPGSVEDWLGSSAYPLDSVIDNIPTWDMSPTIWYFKGFIPVTGTVANPEYFSIYHDDGVTFDLGGQIFAQPGPADTPAHSLLSVEYTGGPGIATFDLVYAECCGGPARLVMTPEPGSLLLLATLLLPLGALIKRRIAPRNHVD